ncbi:MAG: HNH endonuclease, partial [Thermoanaerobaculia bacterium]
MADGSENRGGNPENPTSPGGPSTFSAEELHRETTLAAALQNGARLRLAHGFLASEETCLHRHLGFSSVEQYAERQFRQDHRLTREMIRVARALKVLPKLRETFLLGRLDWSCVEHLSRVATAETEEEWLAFAARKSVRAIKMEVQNAIEKKRTRPRKDEYGIPDAQVKLTFNLRRSEYEIVNQGMGRVSEEMQLGLGGLKPRPEEVLVFMSQRFLETEPEGKLQGRAEKEEPLFTILYHLCPPCREARRPAVMMTRDGPVEVPVEVVERVEAEARKETITPEEEELPPEGARPSGIDRPNPPSLLRKLKLRSGGICENPFCGRRIALQGDHLLERSKGGPTSLANEAMFCVWCHGLRTQGLLEVRGS